MTRATDSAECHTSGAKASATEHCVKTIESQRRNAHHRHEASQVHNEVHIQGAQAVGGDEK